MSLTEYNLYDVDRYMRTGTLPPDLDQRNCQSLLKFSKNFSLSEDKLVYLGQKKDTPRIVVLEDEERDRIFNEYHGAKKKGGHYGRNRTLAKISELFYWYGMTTYVIERLRSCDVCRTRKGMIKYLETQTAPEVPASTSESISTAQSYDAIPLADIKPQENSAGTSLASHSSPSIWPITKRLAQIKKISCQECRKKFSTIKALNQHMKVHASIKRHSCPICGREMHRQEHLDRHFVTHVALHTYQCTICKLSMRKLTLLQKHVTKTHAEVDLAASIVEIFPEPDGTAMTGVTASSQNSAEPTAATMVSSPHSDNKWLFMSALALENSNEPTGSVSQPINGEAISAKPTSYYFSCEVCRQCYRSIDALKEHRHQMHELPIVTGFEQATEMALSNSGFNSGVDYRTDEKLSKVKLKTSEMILKRKRGEEKKEDVTISTIDGHNMDDNVMSNDKDESEYNKEINKLMGDAAKGVTSAASALLSSGIRLFVEDNDDDSSEETDIRSDNGSSETSGAFQFNGHENGICFAKIGYEIPAEKFSNGFVNQTPVDLQGAKKKSKIEKTAMTCPVCNFVTTKNEHMTRHKLTHSNVRPYKCDRCQYASKRSDGLKSHVKRMHSRKNGTVVTSQKQEDVKIEGTLDEN